MIRDGTLTFTDKPDGLQYLFSINWIQMEKGLCHLWDNADTISTTCCSLKKKKNPAMTSLICDTASVQQHSSWFLSCDLKLISL